MGTGWPYGMWLGFMVEYGSYCLGTATIMLRRRRGDVVCSDSNLSYDVVYIDVYLMLDELEVFVEMARAVVACASRTSRGGRSAATR